MNGRPAVLVDCDGTLADVSDIRHHVRPPQRNFDAFHNESVNCPPNPEVVTLTQVAARSGLDVVIVTARKARFRHHTAWWLALHDVPSVAMFMRSDHDQRRDVEVKRDMLRRIRQTWTPVLAVDDNPAILTLWQAEGIPTLRVPGWES